MTKRVHHRPTRRAFIGRLLLSTPRAFCLAALAGLVLPAVASANFEWLGPKLGEFPNEPAEINLLPQGLATNNRTGDLYEGDANHHRVLRFDAAGKFIEAWGWGVGDGKHEFERCGPEAGTPYTECLGELSGGTHTRTGVGGEGEAQFSSPQAIAVDQADGNVYVADPDRLKGIVQEFSESGTYITSFGERTPGKNPVSPEEILTPSAFGLNVDESADVYVGERGAPSGPRVMVFEQTAPGVYTYSRELFHGDVAEVQYVSRDAAGDFLLSNGSEIVEFAAADLATPAWTVHTTEVEGVTFGPQGRVLYYDPKHDLFHVLGPGGVEEGGATFAGAPGEKVVEGIAFDPLATLEGRAAGVVYAGQPSLGAGSEARGFIFAQSARNPPVVTEEKASGIGATSATVSAELDPENAPTTYRVEYGSEGPCETHPCAEAPIGGAEAELATTAESVSVTLSGLSPETTYYYRVVAANEFGPATGPGAKFGTLAKPSGLPDGRAYEMVSPPDKHGGEVFPLDAHVGSCVECEPGRNATKMPEEAAPDGESAVYEGTPFEAQGGAVNENEYLATRTTSGWTSADMSPELGSTGHGRGFLAFSAGLSSGILQQREPPLAPGVPPLVEDDYLRTPAGVFSPLLTEPPIEPVTGAALTYEGATPDLGHVVFGANAPLTRETSVAPRAPKLEAGQEDLYEWSAGRIALVNVLPGREGTAPGATLGSGKELGSLEEPPDYCNAVSADGSRVFWSKVSGGHVYVRENGEETVRLPDGGLFLCASTGGTRVLLSDGHVYSLEGPADESQPVRIADLSGGKPGFLGLAGASEDLSRIYYVDTAQLPSVEGPNGTHPVSGGDNLYLYEAGSPLPRFIGTLAPGDGQLAVNGIEGVWKPSPPQRLAQVSGDGRFLAFESRARLVPEFDNEAPSGECLEGGSRACPEVFEYDVTDGTLTCASCSRSGQQPSNASMLSLLFPIGSRFPQPRNLLSDGRLYFDSFESLTADDVRPGVENVYEYELAGEGTCGRAGGCIYLISSGRSNEDASFFSADESGKNVLFTTRQQLLPEDRDELVDLYDAREGGGFSNVAPPAPCTGEGCRPPAVSSAPYLAPASAAFSGPGNVTPNPAGAVKPVTAKKAPKCRRGKLRRHGKCVKVKRKRRARRAGRGR